jgi:hypothetical protein
MLLCFFESTFLELFLLLSVIKFAIDRVIVMRLPILAINFISFSINFFLNSLLVVLLVVPSDDVVLALVAVQKLLRMLNRQSNISFLKEIIGKLLIVNDIIGIADWP